MFELSGLLLMDKQDVGGSAKRQRTDDTQVGVEYFYRVPQRLSSTKLSVKISPEFIKSLCDAKILGIRKPPGQSEFRITYYELAPSIIREAMRDVFHKYYKYRLLRNQVMDIDYAEVADHAIIVADVCMSALYAKLRNVHSAFGTYSNRYTNPPRYTEDTELPAPFAKAISRIGVFNTELTVNIETIVPTYPEGTENEGCSSQEFPIERYHNIIPHMKNAGIPLESIDIHDTMGTAWWTFKVKHANNQYAFAGLFPPVMYSTLSCQIAQIFIVTDSHGTFCPIVSLRAEDVAYQMRLVDIRDGAPFRAFAALCGGPSEEWNEYAYID